MRTYITHIFSTLVLSFIISLPLMAHDGTSIGIIGDIANNPELCRTAVVYTYSKDCRQIHVTSKQFGNDNTFVQFDNDPLIINGKVMIHLDMNKDANHLMEVLIQIRTLRTMGADTVAVYSDQRLTQNTIDKLALAGAGDLILRDGTHLGLTPFRKSVATPNRRLLAGPPVLVSDNHLALGAEIAKEMSIPFHNSVSKLTENNAPARQVFLLSAIRPPVNQAIFDTLENVRKLSEKGHRVVLITPYFPYSRSDKIDQPGVTVTGRLIADLIENAGAYAVSFARLHAPQAEGFFNIPTIHISGRETINTYLAQQNVDIVISPDAGFQKDATLYADELGKPVLVINKQRDPKSGDSKIVTMGDFDLNGMTAAVIDDETASGGTLGGVAEFLKQQGAQKVMGVVTHLAGAAQSAIDNDQLDSIVVTDSFPLDDVSEQVTKLSLASEYAGTLKRHMVCDTLLTEGLK